jgi:hypothetical protein
MKTEIVVARYNEDLSWLKKIPKTIKITIYNKGNDDIDFPFIQLPNIGRESHTYLYHIIQNYDNLAEQTIFCQGDSIFHSPDFLNLIKNRKYFEPIQPLSAFYWPQGNTPPNYFSNPPLPLLDKTQHLWIKNNRVHVEYMDNEFRTVYPFYYAEDYYVRLIENVKKLYNIDNILKFNVDRFRLKNVDLNELFPVCYAGLFAVSKDVIKQNSVDFYNNIMSILIYDVRYLDNNKILDHGLFLEKLWLLIFNYKKNNKNYITLYTKDFEIYDKNIKTKNNSILFKIFVITCQIFVQFYIDNKYYKIYISRAKITFKDDKNNKLVHYFPRLNIKIQDAIKDMSYITINITLKNNVLILSANKIELINFKFKYNVNNISDAKIFSITDDNKFTNLS